MASKKLFANTDRVAVNTVNNAGGKAYSMSAKHELAQYAATGVFGNTYYTNAEADLERVHKLAEKVPEQFLAQVAIYSRQVNYLKDVPAFLLAVLSTRNTELFKQTFPKVITNGKMLRNFVQIVRSGKAGRKSFGSSAKKAINGWLVSRTAEQLFRDSVGNSPSLADVIRMTHPCPKDSRQKALFAYIIGAKYNKRSLPDCVKEYEAFKEATPGDRTVPDVEFRLLTGAGITDKEWTAIASNAKWQMTFMNLNTFARHGVFNTKKNISMVASRLADEELVKSSMCFPYQIMNAYLNTRGEVPEEISAALSQAMEYALDKIPELGADLAVGVDCSGSMSSPIMNVGSKPSKTRCADVAGLFAAAMYKRNPKATIMTFSSTATAVKLNKKMTVFEVQGKLAQAGGGTNIYSVLSTLNAVKADNEVVILISDNESWMDSRNQFRYSWQASSLYDEWKKYKARVKSAKLVCIDITPNNTKQICDDADVLNVGGFSDNVFDIIKDFLDSKGNKEFWTKKIENYS